MDDAASDAAPPPSTPPSAWSRTPTWVKVSGGVLASLVVLYAGAALLLRALLDPAALADWAEPRVEAALNRDVEIGSVGLAFFPRLGVDVADVEVRNLPEFGGPPLLEVERVRLDLALLPLLRRRAEVGRVRVQAPVLRLLVDEEGRTNFGEMAPPGDEPPEAATSGSPVDLSVRSLRITGARIEYESLPDSTAVVVRDLELRASLDLLRDGSWTVASTTRAPEVLALHPALGMTPRSFHGVTLEADARAGPAFAWLEIDEGTLGLEEAELSLTGRVENLADPVRRVDLRVAAEGMEVANLLTFLPDEMTAGLPGTPAGRLEVAATVVGEVGVGVRPDLRGTVTLREGALTAPSGEALAEGVGGRVLLHNDSVGVEELAGRALGGAFSLGARVHADSLLSFGVSVRANPNLDRIRQVATLPEGTELAGRAEVALSASGRALDRTTLALDGTVDLREFRAVTPAVGVPIGIPAGRFTFAGRNLRWEGVEVTLGPDRLVTGGTVRDALAPVAGPEGAVPHVVATAFGPRLDLDRIFPRPDDRELTYGKVAFAHLGGRTLDGRTPAEAAEALGLRRPESLPASGELTIRIDTLRSEPYRLSAVEARVAFTPDLVQVTEARGGLFGGRIRTAMDVGLGPEPEQPFTLSLGVESVQAADFLSATSPVGRFVQGILGLELQATGSLDRLLLPSGTSLLGTGDVQVNDGQILEIPITTLLARSLARPALANPRFQDLAGRFRVEGSRLVFDESRMALGSQDGELRYGGMIGLDGGLDVAVRVASPALRVDSAALARTGFLGALAGSAIPREGAVHLGLRVRGTFLEPRITPEASLAAGDLRQALEGEARARTEALRAEGERRLEEARDTVQTRIEQARDSAAARLEAERQRAEERAAQELQRELEQRSRGLLQRLRGDPSAREAARADSLRLDSIRLDSIRRDSIRRDSIRRDSIRLDSIRRDSIRRDSLPPDSVPDGLPSLLRERR